MKLFLATLLITSIVLTNAWNQILYSGLSIGDKTDVVQKHNQLRSLLQQGKVSGQPKAAILKTIKYDENLANSAQAISNSGNFQHVLVKDDRWWYVGQNLYVFTTTVTKYKETWSEVIQKWFDEHKDYHYPDASNSKTGHYTQFQGLPSQEKSTRNFNYEIRLPYPFVSIYVKWVVVTPLGKP